MKLLAITKDQVPQEKQFQRLKMLKVSQWVNFKGWELIQRVHQQERVCEGKN
jgi:hypothetical protein